MDNAQNNSKEYYTIDLMHILKSLLRRAWIIILAAILCASMGFCYARFFITPQYSSSVLLYVNTSALDIGGVNVSASSISLSQTLIKTYRELLMNRTTLSMIIEKADLDYTYGQLYSMIQVGPSNNTEVMKVTVTCHDPSEAAKIANSVAEILPIRIKEIIANTSMEVVDSAVPNNSKVSPSITRYTAIGMLMGILISCGLIAVFAIFDDTIHDEDYVISTYDYPILAKVPDLMGHSPKRYGYYYKKNREYKK